MTDDQEGLFRVAGIAADASSGLVPVVAQDRATGEVRMVAYANAAAVKRTLETGKATFFSRSRGELWEKGKTSGHGLDVHAVLVDCDADCLLYLVTPHGPSCHTGTPSCFTRKLDGAGAIVTEAVPAPTALMRLEAVLESRRTATGATSYVKSLYDGGPAKIGEKLREEADELARAVAGEDDARVTSEAADLLFHVGVALRARGVSFTDVLEELDRRAGKSGHVEKAERAEKTK